MDRISFKPLQKTDLDLLCIWLDKPHVKKWWDDELSHDEIKIKYGNRIGDDIVVPFIILVENKPIGFIQYYQADKVGEEWWPDEKAGTVGIDQFIGEEDYVDHGIGTQMIQAFCNQLLTRPGIHKIITDPDPNNHRAIRCYEKAGFKFVKKIMTPEGLVNLMEFKKTKST